MQLRRMTAFISYYANINPYTLDDYEFCSIYNGIEYLLKKRSETE